MLDKKVVSNTTPLITLLGIEMLDILQVLYKKIIIPEAVLHEFEVGREKEVYQSLVNMDWIEVQKVQDIQSLRFLEQDLDKGEAETIILAKEIQADVAIIDEKEGRKYAKNMGLNCVGSLGILLKAKQEKHIETLKPLLASIQSNGIWISDTLIQQILKEAGER